MTDTSVTNRAMEPMMFSRRTLGGSERKRGEAGGRGRHYFRMCIYMRVIIRKKRKNIAYIFQTRLSHIMFIGKAKEIRNICNLDSK